MGRKLLSMSFAICNALGISTSRTEKDSNSNLVDEVKGHLLFEDTFDCGAPETKRLEKSLQSLPQLMDEAVVKEFLLGVGFSETDVRKYKTPSSMAAQTRNSLSKVSSERKKDK